jgi:hypothetical protein
MHTTNLTHVRNGATRASRIAFTEAHEALTHALVAAVQALAALDHDPALLRSLVNQALWDITQFKESPLHRCGGLRWRTPSGHTAACPPWKNLRHEHVVERGWLWRLLRATPEAAPELLWNLPAALVTVEEHLLLPDGRWDAVWGWERYQQAGLAVIDATTGSPADLESMNLTLRSVYAPWVERARQVGASL